MGARVVVGGVFCCPVGNGASEVDFLVLREEEGETLRFKNRVKGWRLLILATRGPGGGWEIAPGEELFAPKGAAITQRLLRLA